MQSTQPIKTGQLQGHPHKQIRGWPWSVMDKQEYTNKAQALLDDTNTLQSPP